MHTPVPPLAGSRPVHTLDPSQVAEAWRVDADVGLSPDEALARRARYGRNELAGPEGRSWLVLLAAQFRSVLVVILLVAAGLAVAVGDVRDAVAITAVLVLNAVLGFVQEHRAERSMQALCGMLPGRAQVRRGGRTIDVDAREVVPGDVLLLDPGDRVAADGRLLVAERLALDESSLTGESQPVDKDAAARLPADTPLADRRNMAHMNTVVAGGRGDRTIYTNIVSFVRFQLATNIAAITVILVARLLRLPTPFTPLQLLWVNLIMDGPPPMALGVDPPRGEAMRRPPRDPRARILDRPRLLRLLFTGGVMAAGTLAVYAAARAANPPALAATMAFTTFVLFQLFNALNARVEHVTILSRHTLTNARLWAALTDVLVLQIAAIHVGPAQQVFDTMALSPGQWATAAAVAATVVPAEELRKLRHRLATAARTGTGAQETTAR